MDDIFFTSHRTTRPTPLFNVAPQGSGTGQVQALLDYLKSLSFMHHLTLNALIELVLGLLGRTSSISQFRQLAGRRCNGKADIARTLVDGASVATGRRDLAASTLLPLSEFVCEHRALSSAFRFCPLCYRETPHGTLPYMRLLWCLSAVTCCPVHRVQLVTPNCEAPNKTAGRPEVITEGVCPRCGSVGLWCSKGRLVEAPASAAWASQQLSDLLAQQANLSRIGPFRSKEFLRSYCNQPGQSMLKLATRASISPTTLWRFITDPQGKMNLGAYLRIAASEKLSLVGLLDGSGSGTNSPSQALELQRPVVVRNRDWGVISLDAPRALAAGQGLASWAKELGVPPRSLVNRLPTECAQLAEQVRKRKAEQRVERMRRLIEECEAIADARWNEKRAVTPLSKHLGRRLNGERPSILKALGLLLHGDRIDGGWPPEVEALLVRAADRIRARHTLPHRRS